LSAQGEPEPAGMLAGMAATGAGGTQLTSHLLDEQGTVVSGVNRAEIESRLAAGTFFWLDLPDLGEEQLVWLREVFGFHPLAIEDAEGFGERPKLEEYPEYTFLVLHGSSVDLATPYTVPGDSASPGDATRPAQAPVPSLDALSEVHFFVAAHYMVTVHRGTCPALRGLAERLRAGRQAVRNPARLFHRVADALVDGFFPVLSELDDRIDAVQARILERPSNAQLAELLGYRNTLVGLRRVVAPQRDIMAGLAGGITQLPGFDDEAQRYFRDIYDHLIRLADLIDGYRDLVSAATDAYLSVTSNQLNAVMKQLTIISTVFLPLSFLTGFFGQNFGWLVGHLGGRVTFFGVGVGTEVIAVMALMALFRSRGWLGGGRS
jgi:magnesium transporter